MKTPNELRAWRAEIAQPVFVGYELVGSFPLKIFRRRFPNMTAMLDSRPAPGEVVVVPHRRTLLDRLLRR